MLLLSGGADGVGVGMRCWSAAVVVADGMTVGVAVAVGGVGFRRPGRFGGPRGTRGRGGWCCVAWVFGWCGCGRAWCGCGGVGIDCGGWCLSLRGLADGWGIGRRAAFDEQVGCAADEARVRGMVARAARQRNRVNAIVRCDVAGSSRANLRAALKCCGRALAR